MTENDNYEETTQYEEFMMTFIDISYRYEYLIRSLV